MERTISVDQAGREYGDCTLEELLHPMTVDCGWRWEKKWNVVSECKALYADFVTPPRPPDLPLGMAGLRVINGGKSFEAESDESKPRRNSQP